MVEGTIDLTSLTILSEKSSEDSLPADPKDLGGHASLTSSLSLTKASVTTTTLGLSMTASTSPGMHNSLALHDESILDEFPNGKACVNYGWYGSWLDSLGRLRLDRSTHGAYRT